jgi:hypothetical protein
MKIKHLLREQAEQAAKQIAELRKVLASLEKMAPKIQEVSQGNHYEFEEIESQLRGLNNMLESSKLGDHVSDIQDAIGYAMEAIQQANGLVYQVEVELKRSIRRVNLDIEDIEESEEWERRYGSAAAARSAADHNQMNENDAEIEEEKASRALCLGSKPDAEIGASQLASCKSQGFRARDGKKSHLVGKKRITVGGHKIKGKKYGGPLPDYGTRKDQK